MLRLGYCLPPPILFAPHQVKISGYAPASVMHSENFHG